MSQCFDVAIAGAGIVGAACAAECARAGLKVVIIDRGCPSGGSTGSAMGHLVVMDDSEAQLALTAYSRSLWGEMASDLPADVEYDGCGTLWIAADEDEMREVLRKRRLCDGRGIRAEVLDPKSLAEAEPNLRAGLAGGLLVPDDAVIYPPCAVRFLLERAVARGAVIHTDSEIIELGENGEVLLADGTSLAAGLVVNAAGCSSPELTAGVPVRKRKGHLVITDRYSGFIRHELVELGYLKSAHAVATDSVAFNIQPRKTGQMLIGSSRQFDVDDTQVEAGILGRMLRRAQEYLPSIGGLSAIRAWAGHRPATPDKLPLIGPSIASDRVWLASGHEGLGITTSLGTARLLADLVLARPTVIPANPYSPRRLARLEAQHV